jgi:hypothetical protein
MGPTRLFGPALLVERKDARIALGRQEAPQEDAEEEAPQAAQEDTLAA